MQEPTLLLVQFELLLVAFIKPFLKLRFVFIPIFNSLRESLLL